jgi:hypothetical protein
MKNGKRQKKMANLNLTATTTYPCFGQDLGDSEGAGSSDLPLQTYAKIIKKTRLRTEKFVLTLFFWIRK